jgi:hypothetical protein
MNVTVEPPVFSIVDYDPDRIAAVAAEVAALADLPDDVRIEVVVEEDNPFGKTATVVDGRSVRMARCGRSTARSRTGWPTPASRR